MYKRSNSFRTAASHRLYWNSFLSQYSSHSTGLLTLGKDSKEPMFQALLISLSNHHRHNMHISERECMSLVSNIKFISLTHCLYFQGKTRIWKVNKISYRENLGKTINKKKTRSSLSNSLSYLLHFVCNILTSETGQLQLLVLNIKY